MKTLSAEDRSQLAAEFVLGTLRGPARRRFERLMQDDPRLWQEVSFWENRLGALGEALPEMTPPPRVWEAIQAEVGADRTAALATKRRGLWQSTPFWRGFALLAAGAAAILLVTVLVPQESPFVPVQIATLQSEGSEAAWLVRVAADGRGEVAPIGRPVLAAGKDFELWLLRDSERLPVSLGLASTDDPKAFALPEGSEGRVGFAISLEPAGGSPTGAPTGPVVFVGNLVGTSGQ